MRITGGQWCGRTLLMPKSELVRPTQDRVREALFNVLAPLLNGARFLDLFAGSGAVGLDALSRGAASVTFLERDKTVFTTLKKNLDAFGVDTFCAHQTDALAWLGLTTPSFNKKRATDKTMMLPASFAGIAYDIVFADPPYLWAKENGFAPIAQALAEQHRLKPGGFLITETDYRTDPADLQGYTLMRDRLYGKTRLVIYQRNSVATEA
ncbi:MAG: 16S rRNA (guanine(966)-N(2))-methyltransferase RsmD [Kiritimatiellae bacterium]|nr:16S rRNA (guanine(966)-N(2))-methyltransferase RsmD [Kiritimatiellia bacterium]